MNLIDRYTMEVARRLPLLRGKKDIQDELRSTLEDMLEDRARKAGRPADEAMEMDLLREYGSPGKVASTYNPMPYLIGPRIFPYYLMTLKIVLAVLTSVLLVLAVVQIAVQSPMTFADFPSALGKALSELFGALISAVGSMTIVFAILERVIPASEFKMGVDDEWDPSSLMKEPEPDDVKPWEPIAAIVFTAIVLSIFNFNPQWIGMYFLSGDKWVAIPVLTDAFFRWLPFINIVWVAEIILNSVLLTTGRWQTSTRLLSIAIKIMEIVIGYMLVTGPSILAITPASLQASGIFDADSARTLGLMAQQGVRSLIVLIMVLEGVDIVKTAVRMVGKRSFALA
jgi:hypothetical protein